MSKINQENQNPLPLSAALTPPVCSAWVGKLTHDTEEFADWGWLRDEAGQLIMTVKVPPMSDAELNQHRRNGTDPTQSRVDAILAAINGQNAPGAAASAKHSPDTQNGKS